MKKELQREEEKVSRRLAKECNSPERKRNPLLEKLGLQIKSQVQFKSDQPKKTLKR